MLHRNFRDQLRRPGDGDGFPSIHSRRLPMTVNADWKLTHPRPLVRRQAPAKPLVTLGPTHPQAQRLGLQPIFPAIDAIAAHREPCSSWCAGTIRTARSRTSGEYSLACS